MDDIITTISNSLDNDLIDSDILSQVHSLAINITSKLYNDNLLYSTSDIDDEYTEPDLVDILSDIDPYM